MTKTNYSLVKLSAGLMFTMFMMLCVLSCDKIDNPVRFYGGGSSSVQQAVATVINVTGANPSDVTAALEAIVTNDAIKAAAAKGEPIKVTVAGSGVSTDATDQTITIPQANGANIEISFATAPTTSNTNPLEFTASSGAAAASGSATNKLAIEMPATTGLVITIELPKTTVVLATNGAGAVTYNKITAKTATNTLIVNNGITIKDLTVEGGNVVIQGGKIDNVTIAENQDVTFTVDGSSMETINIGAGASVGFKRTENHDIYPKIKTVKGDNERTAKFYLPRVKDSDEEIARYIVDNPDAYPYSWTINGIDKISNANIFIPGVPSNERPEIQGAELYNVLLDNCSITMEAAWYSLEKLESAPATITFSNCDFTMEHLNMGVPYLTDELNNTVLEFKNCKFSNDMGFSLQAFATDAKITDGNTYTTTIKFTGCTKGGTDLSTLTPDQLRQFIDGWQTFHSHIDPPAEAKANGAKEYWIDMIFDIDGTKYIIDFPPGTTWGPNPENPEEYIPDHDITFVLYNPE